ETSHQVIEILEIIAEQWNIKHHKQKRQLLKRRLGLVESNSIIIDYDTCLNQFQQQTIPPLSENENRTPVEEEINQMTFEQCLDYLKVLGDILVFEQRSSRTIIVK
ncbi:unnamed protein product, partial [Rotaria socialis]